MSSRLRRTTAGKTTFFAFQDIITSVTGVLILVTLILASHLRIWTSPAPEISAQDLQRQLRHLLREQTQLEMRAYELRHSLAALGAAPEPERLFAEIQSLKIRLDQELHRFQSLRDSSEQQQERQRNQDTALGLGEIQDEIHRLRFETKALLEQDQEVLQRKKQLEDELARVEGLLLKAKNRQGQIWLIPDKSSTTKEPLLVMLNPEGVVVERFDHPESRVLLHGLFIESQFERFLRKSSPQQHYLVFYVRPSAIARFNRLSDQARLLGFEIGYDALEEKAQIHLEKPPDFETLK